MPIYNTPEECMAEANIIAMFAKSNASKEDRDKTITLDYEVANNKFDTLNTLRMSAEITTLATKI